MTSYRDTRQDPNADTRGRRLEFKMFNKSKRNRQENGRGQAKGPNQIRSPGGTEWQAGSRSGQAGNESRTGKGQIQED
jgi:hypothetical protein